MHYKIRKESDIAAIFFKYLGKNIAINCNEFSYQVNEFVNDRHYEDTLSGKNKMWVDGPIKYEDQFIKAIFEELTEVEPK